MTTTMSPTVPTDVASHATIDAASEELAGHMTSEFTSIWVVSDFLLDAAGAVAADPLAVAEVRALHAELAPSQQRSVVRTTDAADNVAKVRRIAGMP
jgi:hypothetical protein